MFNWDWEEIIENILALPLIILIVFFMYKFCVIMYNCSSSNYSKYDYCNQINQPVKEKEEKTHSSGGGLHCGYVFGHGFTCGIW